MRILIANDDGYQSPGIQALHAALKELGPATIVAPDRNRSGASHSLTLSHPILVRAHGPGVYSVEGTPTDSVAVALGGVLEYEPDMVVSGINDGPNMGDDVLYSGTVAAAMEGRSLGHPAIAVSMASFEPTHYISAARVAVELIKRHNSLPLPADSILNVNVPDLPYEQLKGFRSTRLGTRHAPERAIEHRSPRGDRMFWLGAAGMIADAGPGTDFGAVHDGYVSITPLQIDLTRKDTLRALGDWLEPFDKPSGEDAAREPST